MSIASSRTRKLAAAVGLSLALAAPAAASAATPGNPQVIRLDPNGVQTVLAGGAPFTTLGGIAVSSSNVAYVANQGPIGPNPKGAGVYSLANVNTLQQPSAFSPLATTSPTGSPSAVVLNGDVLYSLDGDRVISMTTTAPATQTVLSSGQLYDSLGVNPQFGAVSGTTLYTTADSNCQSAEGGGAYVIAVDTTTGTQTQVADLDCAALGGIAVEPAGTLLVAETSSSTEPGQTGIPQIVRVNPATGSVAPIPTSGRFKTKLKTPQGVAYGGVAGLYVADSTAGILQINPANGNQQLVATPGGNSPLGNAYGLAYSPAGGQLYISEAGVPPTMTVSAAKTQSFSTKGVKLTAACNRTCNLVYTASVAWKGAASYAQSEGFSNVRAKKSMYIRFPGSVNKRIAAGFKKNKTITETIKINAQDPNSGANGPTTKLVVKLTN